MAKNSNNVLAIGVGLNLDPLNKDIQDAANTAKTGMETVGKSISDAGAKADKPLKETRDKLVTLSAQLRQARLDAQQLAAGGKEMSDAFQASVAKAAALKDQIAAVDQAILSNSQTIANQQQPVMAAAKSSYNGMAMSINQLTREMPAFTNSVQTGFMAISNNIPMFVDQINNARVANQQLVASGQPVQSVFSQVASSFFSWQTLMGVGITVLTVYGAEIVKLIGSYDKVSEATAKWKKEIEDTIRVQALQLQLFKTWRDISTRGLDERGQALAAENAIYEKNKQELIQQLIAVEKEEVASGGRRSFARNIVNESIKNNYRIHLEELAKINKEFDQKELESIEKQSLKKRKYQSFEAVQNVTGRLNFSGFGNAPTMPKMPQILPPGYITQQYDKLSDEMLKVQIKLIKINEDMWNKIKDIKEQGLNNIFGNIGQALGNSLAQGLQGQNTDMFGSLRDAMLISIADMAMSVGSALVAAGVALAIDPLTASMTGAYTKIAAGTALIAAGSLAKGLIKGGGGASSAPSNTGSGSVAQSSFNNYGSNGGNFNSNNAITIVGMVRGNDIQFVNGKAGQRNYRSLFF